MNLVCLDTNIVIWGIRKVAAVGQEEMMTRASNLFKLFEADKTVIIVPSIVVAEILSGLEPKFHQPFMTAIQSRFMMPSFDSHAAMLYAQVWQAYKNHQSPSIEPPRPREGLKADSFIIAIALANKASCIYSHDKHLKTMATGFIEVKTLP